MGNYQVKTFDIKSYDKSLIRYRHATDVVINITDYVPNLCQEIIDLAETYKKLVTEYMSSDQWINESINICNTANDTSDSLKGTTISLIKDVQRMMDAIDSENRRLKSTVEDKRAALDGVLAGMEGLNPGKVTPPSKPEPKPEPTQEPKPEEEKPEETPTETPTDTPSGTPTETPPAPPTETPTDVPPTEPAPTTPETPVEPAAPSPSGGYEGGGFVLPGGDQLEVVYKIIAAEGGNISPGEAVNIASTLINRARAGNWGGGNNIYSLATAPNQYVVYQNGNYKGATLSAESRAAVEALFAQCAAGGNPPHGYQSFRSNGSTGYGGTILEPGGNRYK